MRIPCRLNHPYKILLIGGLDLQPVPQHIEKVVLDRCQEELKKLDKITVETAAEFEQKCKQYAEYQMYRADQSFQRIRCSRKEAETVSDELDTAGGYL